MSSKQQPLSERAMATARQIWEAGDMMNASRLRQAVRESVKGPRLRQAIADLESHVYGQMLHAERVGNKQRAAKMQRTNSIICGLLGVKPYYFPNYIDQPGAE